MTESEKFIDVTPKQRNLIRAIARRTEGPESWCAIEDLVSDRTITRMTALERDLRQLERMGLIERRTDNHSREYIRLKAVPDSKREFDLYELSG